MNESLRTLWPYLRRYRRGLVLGFAALALKDAAAALAPLLIREGVDSLTQGFSLDRLVRFAVLLVGLSAVKGVFQYWMRVILIGISRDVEYDLRNDLFAHLLGLSRSFYSRYRTGDIMARATNDLNAVRMMAGPGLMYWSETSLLFVLAVTAMLLVDWPLTLMALAPAPVVSVAVLLFGRYVHARFERIQKMFSDISSRVQENLAGARIIRAYAQEAAEMRRFEEMNRGYIAQNVKLARASGMFMPMLQSLIGVAFLVVMWGGGARLLQGRISLGTFLMFNTYMGLLIWPMIAFGWVVNLMQRGSASLKRINEILREPPAIAAPERPRALPEPVRGEIEFRDVAVVRGAARILDGISLTIPAGAVVAFVGHTGSGKTTLAELIPRLIDADQGSVRIDGVDVKDLDPAELRRQTGFVPQESFLFSATLADNIALGVAEASEEQILRAAESAGLGPDIAGFPDGCRVVVGERGLTLSGGQKQRTAIARAILREPRILILDDALSSVDTLTEERILTGLARMTHERTTILISHRVSTVRGADRIFVLEQGRLVEQGSHDELLELGGYYADLYHKQLIEEELQST